MWTVNEKCPTFMSDCVPRGCALSPHPPEDQDPGFSIRTWYYSFYQYHSLYRSVVSLWGLLGVNVAHTECLLSCSSSPAHCWNRCWGLWMALWELYIPLVACSVSLWCKAPWSHPALGCSSQDCGAPRLQPWTDRPPLTRRACVQTNSDLVREVKMAAYAAASSVCRKTIIQLQRPIHRNSDFSGPTCDADGSRDIQRPYQTPWLQLGWLALLLTGLGIHSHLSLGQGTQAFDGTTCCAVSSGPVRSAHFLLFEANFISIVLLLFWTLTAEQNLSGSHR